ncbi:unnamed protein product [Staurois parvus]|uniref:Uncharacterized protein n=1 Tax=Staurois parvus TaxID=386267 RepID=A0ABN9BE30_9NEOB|nr:unnamed protein product [Staurois parvus]
MWLCIKNEAWRAQSDVAGEGGGNAFQSMLNRLLLQRSCTSWTLLPDPIDIVCCWTAGCPTWI